MPKLAPGFDPKIFSENPKLAEETAFRNGSLQGGYLIMAARAVGLDRGPMSGFDPGNLMPNSFRTAGGRPTSSAISGMAIPKSCVRPSHGSISTKLAGFYNLRVAY